MYSQAGTPPADPTLCARWSGAVRRAPCSAVPAELAIAVRVTALLWAITTLAAILGALAPELAAGARRHPALHGTVGEVIGILATNLRVLAAPFLLALFRWPAGRHTRRLGDLVIAALVLVNTMQVGLAVGRFGAQLFPYLPHLPLEWAALGCSAAAWLTARDDGGLRELACYALATVALTISAAAVEVLLTPHTRTGQRTGRRVLPLACDPSLPPCGERVRVAFAGFCAVGGQDRFKVTSSLPLTQSVRFRSADRPALPDYVNHPIPTGGTSRCSTA